MEGMPEPGVFRLQASMIADELVRGKLVVACDCSLKLSEPYTLAWIPHRLIARSDGSFIIQAGHDQRRAMQS
jgi:hypothetical protein